MNTETFNYRKQLIILFFHLDRTIHNLYHMAFNIGLNEEWPDLKTELKDGDWLPLDIAYLRAIKDESVPGIIEMIEILVPSRDKLVDVNQITDEELILPEELIPKEGSEKQEFAEEDYRDMWLQAVFVDLLSIFEACWVLAYSTYPPAPIYDEFSGTYYDSERVRISSKDYNVRFLMEVLDEVLEVNRKCFYA